MSTLNYDAVVIGAGNGGLCAALRLAKSKKKVLLVERHLLPGGFATSFIRGRFEFEASLHELCDFGHEDLHGNLYELFKDFDVLKDMEFVDVPDAFRVISLSTNEDYALPFGIDNFINKMEEYVPGSKKSVTTFFELGAEIQKALKYLNESHGHPDTKVMMEKFPNFMRTATYSTDEVLNAIKMPKKAQQIIDTYWSYLGTGTAHLGFTHYCIMVYLYISLKAQIPTNRSHGISQVLEKAIRDNGGEIFYGDEVVKILTDNKAVSGVVLASGKVIKTKHVISNAMPVTVYGRMVDKKDVPLHQIKKANFNKLAGRGFSMFLGLNKSPEELGLHDYSYFIYDDLDSNKQFEKMKSIDNHGQVVVVLNNALPNCSPKGTTIMYFTSLYFSDCFDKALTKENYFELKDKLANTFLDAFEKATKTNIRDYIEEIEVGTPLTYAHYTDAPDGTIYGYLTEDLDNMMARLTTMYNEEDLKGLRFCGGHSVRSSGYNSSYLSGDLAAKLTLGDMKEDK